MADKPNYYDILGLPVSGHATLTPQALRAAYRRAILRHHPDKSSPATLNPSSNLSVDDVALAYKTLSEPALKAEYDRHLRDDGGAATRPLHTGLETVDLDDLDFEEGVGRWTRGCRCGKRYVVTEDDLERNVEDGEVIIGCRGCSLWLRVLFSVDE